MTQTSKKRKFKDMAEILAFMVFSVCIFTTMLYLMKNLDKEVKTYFFSINTSQGTLPEPEGWTGTAILATQNNLTFPENTTHIIAATLQNQRGDLIQNVCSKTQTGETHSLLTYNGQLMDIQIDEATRQALTQQCATVDSNLYTSLPGAAL
jgi:ABC-type lipoprotein release transport system permease subunit